MLTENDLRKIKKLLTPLATKKDIRSDKTLTLLWEKYAKIVIKLDQHEQLIQELQKKNISKKEVQSTIVGMKIIYEGRNGAEVQKTETSVEIPEVVRK